jgi:hypothetical protein
MMQVSPAEARSSSGSSAWQRITQVTPYSRAAFSMSGWWPQMRMVSFRRKGGSSVPWGRARMTSPEMVLTMSTPSLSSWPSSTLRMLNRGTFRSVGSSMVRMS